MQEPAGIEQQYNTLEGKPEIIGHMGVLAQQKARDLVQVTGHTRLAGGTKLADD
jgi:hypothetical protein